MTQWDRTRREWWRGLRGVEERGTPDQAPPREASRRASHPRPFDDARAASIPRPFDEARRASYPPPYPDGWYRIAATADVKPGQVRYVENVGRQIALFRSDLDGRVHALEAFCPHLGANLADGRVVGGTLRCPFHGWCIDGFGKVTDVPYTHARPTARHPHFDVVDYCGMVFVYVAAAGPGPAPYRLPEQPQIESGKMVFRGERVVGEFDMHIMELAENAADVQHFGEVHGEVRVPWTQVRLPGCKVVHEMSYPESPEPHVYVFRNAASIEVLGRRMDWVGATADVSYHGPASLAQFDFLLHDGRRVRLFQTCTPFGPMRQRITFRWFSDRTVSRFRASLIVGGWASQIREDAAIWTRKIYRDPPVLAKGDGPMRGVRAWYQQFFGGGG